MLDTLSVGAATLDIFIKSPQFIVENNLIALKHSSKNEISQSLICSGGGATNSATAFSRLGLKSTCLSLVGDDHLSLFIFDDLKKEKISTNYLIKNKNDSTDFSVIMVAPDGGRSILTNRGSTRLDEKYFNWDKIPKSKWLYISSLEGNLDLLEKLIGFAKENGSKIALNPGNRELSQRKKILPLLKLTDLLLLNKTEAESLVGLEIIDHHFWPNIIKLSPPIVCITNGREGSFVFADGQHYFSPIINVKPVDETGAGDAFGSTFVAALIYGHQPKDALFWAVKNSASVVSAIGAKTKLLTLKQITNHK